MNPADPVNQLRLALADQVSALDRLVLRAESARLLIPRGDPARWAGPASLAFELALGSVSAELDRAVIRLSEAAAESRRALAGTSARA